MSNLADRIRRHVNDEYVRPARKAKQSTVRVRAGDVHRALGLNNQVPAVCGAIDARKCLEEIGATAVRRSGPHQSTTAEWEFALGSQGTACDQARRTPIMAVWERGCFRPLKPLQLVEGQRVGLILDDASASSAGGRFAAFAGTLTSEEAREMRQDLDREFGRLEGEW